MFTSPKAVMVTALTIAALVLGGCDSGSSSSAPRGRTLDVKAIQSDLSGRGPYSLTGKAKFGRQRGIVSGAFDTPAKLGVVRIPVFQVDQAGRAELRIVGDNAYLRRAVIAGSSTGGLNAALVDPSGAGGWLPLPGDGSGFASLIVGAYVPQFLLQQLALTKLRWTGLGPQRIGSETATGAKAVLAGGAGLGLKSLSLWTVANTLVRVEFETAVGVSVRYDLASTREAPTVRAPSPGQIVAASAVAAPAGDFTQVASGEATGVSYRVFRSLSSAGGTCWRVEATPAFDAVGGAGTDGHRCVPATTPEDDFTDQVQFVIDASARSAFEMIGVRLPPGATAQLTLAGGTTQPLVADGNGLAVYAGPASPIAGYVEVTLLGGAKLACGPGSVTSPSDVGADGQALGQALDLRATPWSCLTFESLGK